MITELLKILSEIIGFICNLFWVFNDVLTDKLEALLNTQFILIDDPALIIMKHV